MADKKDFHHDIVNSPRLGKGGRTPRKVVIYSSNGSANYDLRIQSQACFLEAKGFSVTVIEPTPASLCEPFDWSSFGITYISEEVNATQSQSLAKAIAALRVAREANRRKWISRVVVNLAIWIVKILCIANARAVRRAVFCKLQALQPSVIITRDIIPQEILWFQKRYPDTRIVTDMHEVVFWQEGAVNEKLRAAQFSAFKTISAAVCVTEEVRTSFYSDIGKPVFVIPNAPSSLLCKNVEFNSRAHDGHTLFLIHGGYLAARDFLVDVICEVWSKTPESAVLCVRMLNQLDIHHLARRHQKMPRILFLPSVHGGFQEELKRTAGLFDIGILPIPTNVSPMYTMCSPNRLALYLHAGLGILHTPSCFVDEIGARSKAGSRWDGSEIATFVRSVQELARSRERVEALRRSALDFAKTEYVYECYGQPLADLIASRW